MRSLLLLLLCSVAHADVRLDAHVGGGLEGGLIQGKARPDRVGEVGAGVAYFGPAKRWGLGLVLERVERPEADLPIGAEYKLDALVRFTNRDNSFVGGAGAGIRKLTVAGDEQRRGSTLWGVDLLRMNLELRLARVGPVSVELYFAWTFGLYVGEVYGQRYGDMAYPVRDYQTIASSYVLGLQTSFDTK